MTVHGNVKSRNGFCVAVFVTIRANFATRLILCFTQQNTEPLRADRGGSGRGIAGVSSICTLYAREGTDGCALASAGLALPKRGQLRPSCFIKAQELIFHGDYWSFVPHLLAILSILLT